MRGLNLFDMMEKYADIAPKNMLELLEFADKCDIMGYTESAKYIREWTKKMNFYIETEWFVGELQNDDYSS